MHPPSFCGLQTCIGQEIWCHLVVRCFFFLVCTTRVVPRFFTSQGCEWEGDVVAVVAPLCGVAQVVSRGVKVVGVHGEEGK